MDGKGAERRGFQEKEKTVEQRACKPFGGGKEYEVVCRCILECKFRVCDFVVQNIECHV